MARERFGIPMEEWKRREAALVALRKLTVPAHDCDAFAEYVETDGALGQAYYCGKCGKLLQVG